MNILYDRIIMIEYQLPSKIMKYIKCLLYPPSLSLFRVSTNHDNLEGFQPMVNSLFPRIVFLLLNLFCLYIDRLQPLNKCYDRWSKIYQSHISLSKMTLVWLIWHLQYKVAKLRHHNKNNYVQKNKFII